MLFKLALKDLKKTLTVNVLILTLLAVVFLMSVTLVSSIQVRFLKYWAVAPYLQQNGFFVQADYLQKKAETGGNLLLRDEYELKELLPSAEEVLTVEKLWMMYLRNGRRMQDLDVWCYSDGVVKAMNPAMHDGRWFTEVDMQSNSDTLKAVLAYNTMDIKVGDTVTVGSQLSGVVIKVEIIGIIEDNEMLFSGSDASFSGYRNYRDCYYTYNYEMEDKPLMILSDTQILNGQEDGRFEYLNFRMNAADGFQKQMCGSAIVTYPNTVPQELIDADLAKLSEVSSFRGKYSLSLINDNSWSYILEELWDYFPVFLCALLFAAVAAISANVVTVKKQLRSYALYYICGLGWKKCAKINLIMSGTICMGGFLLAVIALPILRSVGVLGDSTVRMGTWQITVCFVITVLYTAIAWIIPMRIMRKTSAKEIMTSNQ